MGKVTVTMKRLVTAKVRGTGRDSVKARQKDSD